jgi:hypothetical protein
MRLILSVVALVLLFHASARAQNATPLASPDAAAGQEAAIAALNFRQGDAAGFNHARPTFTGGGWTDFLTHWLGSLDAEGAPTFTSIFAPRAARLVGDDGAILHIQIPGTWTRITEHGKKTYERFAIEVTLMRDPVDRTIKIHRIAELKCGGPFDGCH